MTARGTAVGSVEFDVVRQLRSKVAQELTAERSARLREQRAPLGEADEQRLAQSLISKAVSSWASAAAARSAAVPDGALDGRLAAAVEAAMFGAGPLQPLLENPEVENIDINGFDQVWVTYASGERALVAPLVDSDEDLIEVFRSLASHVGPVARPWSTVHPQLDLGLPGGVRVSGLLAASARPQISIRRDRLGAQAFLDEVPRRYFDAISLVTLGTLDRQCALFLAAAVRARSNILIAGATNVGKTTLLRALTNAIPEQERLITIEQALELRLGRDASLHADVVELETVLPSPEGKGGLDGADLVRRSKRMNPDRLIFGEVLHGPEARSMLEAMLQGGDGSMSTIHSRDAYGAINRLIIGLGALNEPVQPATAAALIGAAVDFVVYVSKTSDGHRAVTEILEISGHQGETVSCATIFAVPPTASTTGVGAALTQYGQPVNQEAKGHDRLVARRDPRIPLKRAELLARHGYTDERGEQLNAETPRRRNRDPRPSATTAPGTAYAQRDARTERSAGRVPADNRRHTTPSGPADTLTKTAGTAGPADPASIPLLGIAAPGGQSSPPEAARLEDHARAAEEASWHHVVLPADSDGPSVALPPSYPAEPLIHAPNASTPPTTPEDPTDNPRARPGTTASRPSSRTREPSGHSGNTRVVSPDPARAAAPAVTASGPIIDLGARRTESPDRRAQGHTRSAAAGPSGRGRRRVGVPPAEPVNRSTSTPAPARRTQSVSPADDAAAEPEWKKIGLPGTPR